MGCIGCSILGDYSKRRVSYLLRTDKSGMIYATKSISSSSHQARTGASSYSPPVELFCFNAIFLNINSPGKNHTTNKYQKAHTAKQSKTKTVYGGEVKVK
jgi:hypothetical protein